MRVIFAAAFGRRSQSLEAFESGRLLCACQVATWLSSARKSNKQRDVDILVFELRKSWPVSALCSHNNSSLSSVSHDRRGRSTLVRQSTDTHPEHQVCLHGSTQGSIEPCCIAERGPGVRSDQTDFTHLSC